MMIARAWRFFWLGHNAFLQGVLPVGIVALAGAWLLGKLPPWEAIDFGQVIFDVVTAYLAMCLLVGIIAITASFAMGRE